MYDKALRILLLIPIAFALFISIVIRLSVAAVRP
jgi:hypothetical protein